MHTHTIYYLSVHVRTSTADAIKTSMQALEALACLHSHTMQWLTSDHMDSCVQGDTADLQPDGFCSAARRIAPWDCTFIEPGEEGVARCMVMMMIKCDTRTIHCTHVTLRGTSPAVSTPIPARYASQSFACTVAIAAAMVRGGWMFECSLSFQFDLWPRCYKYC
jgi:hypothetical protein